MPADSLMSLDSLLQGLQDTERDVASFFCSLSDSEFVRSLNQAWSPAQHLDHLNTAVSAVARGFAMSPLLLRLRFGSSKRDSRSYEQLRSDYQSRLSAGGRATGRFVPVSMTNSTSHDAPERRKNLLERWTRVNGRLRKGLGVWSEQDLERVQMPHPLLGKITARELVYFTIYHGRHHVAAVQNRLAVDA